MGAQDNIIYRLVMRNSSYHAYFFDFVSDCFGKEMGMIATGAPQGHGPQNPTKNLARWVD